MPTSLPTLFSNRRALIVGLGATTALAACAGRSASPPDDAEPGFVQAARAELEARSAPYREVRLFGVVATPGRSEIDPKLEAVGMVPQLRQFLDGCTECGVKLLGSQSRERLATDQTLMLDLENGYSASAELGDLLTDDGKVQLRFTLSEHGQPRFQRVIATPPTSPSSATKPCPTAAVYWSWSALIDQSSWNAAGLYRRRPFAYRIETKASVDLGAAAISRHGVTQASFWPGRRKGVILNCRG